MPTLTLFLSAAAITLSSLLLFVVQPIVARELLPAFGGSPMVWATTMLFFQVILLGGYTYAHWMASSRRARLARYFHLGLLVTALAFLPLSLRLPEQDAIASSPSLYLLVALSGSLLVPATLLASTNPLVQSWLVADATARGIGTRGIYRWFALSNLGSLGGLLSYPFLIAPRLQLTEQRWWWTAAFGVFVGLSGILSLRRTGAPALDSSNDGALVDRTSQPVWLWCLLAAAGSWLYLATTNQITRNVAPVPFLWVVPLSLYLVSFILCFERDGWYRRTVWLPVGAVTIVGSCYLLRQTIDSDYVLQLVVYLGALFAGAMVAHGELARLRPARGLTRFYLSVAFGGALGGLGVSLLAPALFADYWEYPIAFLWLAIAFTTTCWYEHVHEPEGDVNEWYGRRQALVVLICLTAGFVAFHIYAQMTRTTLVRRNFFGVLRVYDGFRGTESWRRDLWNGGIGHGGQFLAPSRRMEPTMYFGPDSGVGLTLQALEPSQPGRGRRIGVLGLGVGTLASYGEPGDEFVFYELNPDVAELARSSFYYLSETRARTEIRIGDGRQTLMKEHLAGARAVYDLLVMDAFTGDAIPVHLLTREAFELYHSMLRPGGILAVNISNIHFDLRPVLRAQAEALGAVALFFADDGNADHLLPSDWVVITTNAEFVAQSGILSRATPWMSLDDADEDLLPDLSTYLWTDDFYDVFSVLRERD